MSLTSHDIERIADDIYKDRRINSTLYCGRCGYNLRTLPYLYTCPECGNQYNARPPLMKGIFTPHEIMFPFRDYGLTLLGALSTLLLSLGLGSPLDVGRLIMALILGVFTVIFGYLSIGRSMQFIRDSRVAHRIRQEEEALEEDEEEEW